MFFVLFSVFCICIRLLFFVHCIICLSFAACNLLMFLLFVFVLVSCFLISSLWFLDFGLFASSPPPSLFPSPSSPPLVFLQLGFFNSPFCFLSLRVQPCLELCCPFVSRASGVVSSCLSLFFSSNYFFLSLFSTAEVRCATLLHAHFANSTSDSPLMNLHDLAHHCL